jgi:hypothetical protein
VTVGCEVLHEQKERPARLNRVGNQRQADEVFDGTDLVGTSNYTVDIYAKRGAVGNVELLLDIAPSFKYGNVLVLHMQDGQKLDFRVVGDSGQLAATGEVY